ncbi:hypothetical protein RUND412_002593 [Rhizina undulata]
MSPAPPRPLVSRKRDLIYFTFFCIHVPIILFVDSIPYYPQSLVPQPLKDLHVYYCQTYNDQLVITKPGWFRTFAWVEILYQLPFGIWALVAIKREDPRTPVHLLVFSVICAITTLPCLVEFYDNQAMSWDEKKTVWAFYSPYFVLFTLMGLDMIFRIQKTLVAASTLEKKRV